MLGLSIWMHTREGCTAPCEFVALLRPALRVSRRHWWAPEPFSRAVRAGDATTYRGMKAGKTSWAAPVLSISLRRSIKTDKYTRGSPVGARMAGNTAVVA